MRLIRVAIVFFSLACGGAPSAPPEGAANPAWLAGVERHLREREYHASTTRDGLQAPNRRHDLRTYFSGEGIRVVDRTADGSPDLVALSLEGFGPGEVSHEKGRVEITRGNGLVEWYENGPDGLEQGFTLATRPPRTGSLALDVTVVGAEVSPMGDGLEFHSQTGRRLRYAKLHVEDARGETLDAHFATTDTGFRILVDDDGASYPIVIDPLLTESVDNDVQSNQVSANLGTCVASAGDVNADGYRDVIVGAYLYDNGETNEGAAFLFHGGPDGIGDGDPTNAATLLESNQASSRFGFSCDSAGDVDGDGYHDVIIGAYLYTNGQTTEGAAFVFHGGPGGIPDGNPSTAAAQLEGDQASAFFGRSVAGAGDVNLDGFADVIVGADDYDAGQGDEGAAFVFLADDLGAGIGSRGAGAADTRIESDQANARLGMSVASAGDVNHDGYADVIVGAHLYDEVSGATDVGAAFVLHGSPGGIGAAPDTVISGVQAGAQLGISAASAGDVNGDGFSDVIVGAQLYTSGETDEGAAFVFHGSAAGIVASSVNAADAVLESNQADSRFAGSVDSAGDVNGDGYADVVVGAQLFDSGETDEGAAFVFLGSAAGIGDADPASAYAQLETDQADARMGRSVASAGDVNGDGYDDVLVGAFRFDGPDTDEGQAFVYHGGAEGVTSGDVATAHAEFVSGQTFAYLGISVASAGDVNGDGYGDVIVGAPGYDAGEAGEGAAFVFLGTPTGIASGDPSTAHAQLESNQTGASLGFSAASAGDVDGDGYGDVIVGAFDYDDGELDEGAAFIFHGSASGLADGDPASADAKLTSDQGGSRLGSCAASAGDVNGDGFADVIVGAFDHDDQGAAFVFHGGPAGIGDRVPLTANASLESDQLGSFFGIACGTAGDVDADGYSDVVVGAHSYTAGQSGEGAAFVFLGSVSGVVGTGPASAHAGIEADQIGARLGNGVGSAGDVNDDGYADLIVGAERYDFAGAPSAGGAFVFHGGPAGILGDDPLDADTLLEGPHADSSFGLSVGGAGDVNGDGYADVIVGAPEYDVVSGEGAAFVFHGSAAGVPSATASAADAQLDSQLQGAALGARVAGAGDVNGDGYADVIVSALNYPIGGDPGAAFVFLGNTEGRPVLTQQRRADASGVAVAPGGISFSANAFQAEMLAIGPRGLERARLEVEACPSGIPFGDVACSVQQSFSWVALGTPAPTHVLDVTGLDPNEVYSWRARLLYRPYSPVFTGDTPSRRAGPWRRLQARATPGDIRLPEPGLHLGLAAGLVLLAALRRQPAGSGRRSSAAR